MVHVKKNVDENSISLFSVVSKVFEKLVNRLFFCFQNGFGLADHLQIFLQLYLTELLGLLTSLGLLEL